MATIEEYYAARDLLMKFVADRVDEDERIARATVQWSPSWQDFTMDGELRDDENAGTIAICLAPQDRAHIARHDPARVLRRCASIRDFLEKCGSVSGPGDIGDGMEIVYGLTLRTFAKFWPDHPDYEEERWAAWEEWPW